MIVWDGSISVIPPTRNFLFLFLFLCFLSGRKEKEKEKRKEKIEKKIKKIIPPTSRNPLNFRNCSFSRKERSCSRRPGLLESADAFLIGDLEILRVPLGDLAIYASKTGRREITEGQPKVSPRLAQG